MATETATIGNVFTWVKGKKPTQTFEIASKNAIPYLSAAYFRTQKPDFYTSAADKNCVAVNKDDIVLIWDGSNAGDVFRGLSGALSSTMVKFNKSSECDDSFLYFLLKNNFNILNKGTTGSTIPHVNGSILKDIKMPISDIVEQKSIARVLTTVQEAIAGQEKLIAKLKDLKRSMMQYLFTHGTWDEKTKITEIGEMPESWDVVELGKIAEFKNGINFSKEQKGNIGIKTIDVYNMYGGDRANVKLKDLYCVNKKISNDFLLKKGDVLFVRSSLKQEGIGWTCYFNPVNEDNYTFCGFIIRARLDNSIIDPEFLANYFRTELARRSLIAGSGKVAITNINQGMLSNLKIPLPTKDEQKLVVKSIYSIDQKIELVQGKISSYHNLFKTLLHELMSGERRVKN